MNMDANITINNCLPNVDAVITIFDNQPGTAPVLLGIQGEGSVVHPVQEEDGPWWLSASATGADGTAYLATPFALIDPATAVDLSWGIALALAANGN
jgi:hypothetical protein